MQALFSMDMNNAFSMKMLVEYSRSFPPNKKVAPYFQRLTEGVVQNKDHIDKVIETYSSNWKVRRMACVDRNILRLAVFEMLYSRGQAARPQRTRSPRASHRHA